ncbi:DUF4190 domain-containing protein [Myceligenerans indicum]|uniref:DUF4190 domain-containing protein n=1 Tax=Myceligenerans indicum TaxID=2593663 RepID=A0ABS1LI00_9MICO|nr:DUF4190 domain-containing protein [Myceligenerans indicum]MBL0885773.1 DUF4190 domain-containing protein [Myceligenerans indicum]
MSTNEPGAQNPYDPRPGEGQPGPDPEPPGQGPQPSWGQQPPGGTPQQPGVPTSPPGVPQPSPYAAGGVPPSAFASPSPASGMPYPGQPYPKNSLGVWSLVLGILSWFVCPIVASIGAIVTGHLSRRAVREGQADNGGLGLAGIILGWTSIALSVIAIIIFVVVLGAVVTDPAFRDYIDDPSMWPTING